MGIATINETKQRPYVVLHVEDDEELGASVAALLRVQGFEPIMATDGASALAQVAHAHAPPDVLIMDFNLHGDMDGADVAQEVCHAIGHVVPTIFLSGELANAGMPWLPGAPLLFIAKPADPEVLLKAVESFAALGRFLTSRTHD
jgi:DNA-binding response OmpR family regulator